MASIILQCIPTKVSYCTVLFEASPWTTTGELNLTSPLPTLAFGPLPNKASLDISAPQPKVSFAADTYALHIAAAQPVIAFTGSLNNAIADFTASLPAVSFTAFACPIASLEVTAPSTTLEMSGYLIQSANLALSASQPVFAATGMHSVVATLYAQSCAPVIQFTGVFNLTASLAITAPAPYVYLAAQLPQSNTSLGAMAVNLLNMGNTEYTNYNFTELFEWNGTWHGVLADGVYTLTGETDNGAKISSSIKTKLFDFDSAEVKYVHNLYIGARNSESFEVDTIVDELDPITYEVFPSDLTTLNERRIKTAKGVKGRHWQFGIRNPDGNRFDIQNLHCEVLLTKRTR